MKKYIVSYEVSKVATIEAKSEAEAVEIAMSGVIDWEEAEITSPAEAREL